MDKQVDAVQIGNKGSAKTAKTRQMHRRRLCRRAGAENSVKRINKEISLLQKTINHDILNQLAALYTLLGLSELEDTTPQMKEYIWKGQKIAQTMQWQLRFMRDFQEAGTKGSSWQRLESVIGEVIDQFSLPDISMDCQVGQLEIYADPLLKCVFYNLIVNSLMHGERVNAISIHTEESDGVLAIVYNDNGCGIGCQEKEKIFLKGYGKNSGQGLYFIREIMRINGMTIHEDGEPGRGARFVIRVPDKRYRIQGTLSG